jgi:hypothetical protein
MRVVIDLNVERIALVTGGEGARRDAETSIENKKKSFIVLNGNFL